MPLWRPRPLAQAADFPGLPSLQTPGARVTYPNTEKLDSGLMVLSRE